MDNSHLPSNPFELFRFNLIIAFFIRGIISFIRIIGIWKYPIKANGDVEKMTILDKLYWLYKTQYPVQKPFRNSGLKEYFERRIRLDVYLPPEFSEQHELTLSAVGDLINHKYLSDSRDSLYANEFIHHAIFGSDITTANLECPIFSRIPKKFEFDFKAPPLLYYDHETFSVVKSNGNNKYTFMSTACNHSLDFGMEGVESTIEILQKENIAFHGTNLNKDDVSKATIVEKKGFKIGMIAYTFGLNAHSPPQSHPYLVNVLNLNGAVERIDFSQIKAQVKYCHDQQVDFIMAHLHWGMEHEFYPTPAQVEVAHHLAELGIDAIIGHHPHVAQPMEVYRTKRDPHRLVPIYYSLGNLVNYFSAPFLCKSAIAQITLAKGYLDNETPCVYVKEANYTQVFQTLDKDKKVLKLVPNQELLA